MSLRFSILQFHSVVGDIQQNLENLTTFYLQAVHQQTDLDLVISGELVLSGYIPLDELYYKQYFKYINQALNSLQRLTQDNRPALMFSDVYLDEHKDLYNAVYVIQRGKITNIIKKQKLVDYDVFNESRYFLPGKSINNLITINGAHLAVVICEDLWHQDIVNSLVGKDISGLITINASPYAKYKYNDRIRVARYAANTLQVPIIYVNIVGGIDGVVFDGYSFVMNKELSVIKQLAFAEEDTHSFKLNKSGDIYNITNDNIPEKPQSIVLQNNKYSLDNTENLLEEFYKIIQLGFKDFINDNSINGVIIGLSGGIDSALSATIAADTLGSEKVICVSIPSQYTSELSLNIINELAKNLNVKLHSILLDKLLQEYKLNLELNKALCTNNNLVWDNLQSRIRSNILMAISNSYEGYVVLSNANKSELATGYFTLYGDSCGAFNLLKDLYKVEVFDLARWRNNNVTNFSKIKKLNIIPESCIARSPSAELHYNQTDEEDLLPYNTIDNILMNYIENNLDYTELLKKFAKDDVNFILKLLKKNEYKRKQSIIGIKLKNRSFGKDWQYPITNGFKDYDSNN